MRPVIFAASLSILGMSAFAQSEDRAPINLGAVTPVPISAPQAALGSVLQGPLDVMNTVTAPTAPGTVWNRQLGCAKAWGYYWVSGGAGTSGAFGVHQFDLTGAYLQTFTQDMSLATASQWGMRDLEVDEPTFKMWGGMEGRVLKEYTFNPGAGVNGTLSYTTTYVVPTGGTFTSSQTIRALTRDPATGFFWSKNFNSAIWQFSIVAGVPAYQGELAGNGLATYGMKFDTVTNLVWQFDQVPAGTDAVQFNEIDPLTGSQTGRTFQGVTYGVANTNLAGGCSFINDGSGTTKILALHQNTADELYVYELDSAPTSVTYCTAGTTTNGCNASMSSTGVPSVSATSGFTLTASNLEGQKLGLLFYSITGQAATPWGASSSFLCVAPPTQRLPSTNSNGTAGLCDGSISADFLAYLAANPFSLGMPFSSGDVVNAQCWFRDPPSPKTTHLSNGIQVTMQP